MNCFETSLFCFWHFCGMHQIQAPIWANWACGFRTQRSGNIRLARMRLSGRVLQRWRSRASVTSQLNRPRWGHWACKSLCLPTRLIFAGLRENTLPMEDINHSKWRSWRQQEGYRLAARLVTSIEAWYTERALVCLVAQPCLTLCDPRDCSPPGSSVHGDSPGKSTGVGCHALL